MAEDRSPVGRLFGAIVPRAVDAVDPDDLLDRVDIEGLIDRIDVDGMIRRVDLDALLARIDLDGLIGRIDLDRLLDRIDIDGLIRRVDLDALLTRIDVDALVARIDLDALVGRLDVDALVARLDVDALVARIDLDALVGRLDVDALVGRLDLDALLARVDLRALVARAGIDDIVAEATTGMAARTLDLARRQVVGVDTIALRGVDRVLRRRPEAPPPGEVTATGRPAGPVARILAFLADAAAVSLLFTLAVALGRMLAELFTGRRLTTTDAGPAWTVAYFGWWFTYLWVSLVIAGRTPGKALVGLRVRSVAGDPLSGGRAALRVVLLPFAMVLGLGLIPGVVRRDRRALHDLAAGSQEVIDWGDRPAELPSALQRWVRDHRLAVIDGGGAGDPTPPPAPGASGLGE